MPAPSTSTVRSHAKGFARRDISFGLFLAVAALPLLSMGITIPSAVAKRRAVQERDYVRSRLAERQRLHTQLSEYRSGATLETLRELHEELVGMIPEDVGHLAEFGELRSSAESIGVELAGITHVRTHSVDGSDGSGDVVVDEVLVMLNAPVNQAFGLVGEVRRHGLPVLVLGFELARETPQVRTFQTELRLGFVRRITPSSVSEAQGR